MMLQGSSFQARQRLGVRTEADYETGDNLGCDDIARGRRSSKASDFENFQFEAPVIVSKIYTKVDKR